MPGHRNLNVKKFLDSVSEPLLRDYFQWKCEAGSPVESYDPQTIERFLNSRENPDLTTSIREDFNQIKVSSPGESHPQALAEPDVNLSAHPAPIIQPPA